MRRARKPPEGDLERGERRDSLEPGDFKLAFPTLHCGVQRRIQPFTGNERSTSDLNLKRLANWLLSADPCAMLT